jgi:conjugative transfer signal peptidase TraF
MNATRSGSGRAAPVLCLAVALLYICVWIAGSMGYRINVTPSVPVGIWRVMPVSGKIERGQIVSICPPLNAAFIEASARGYLSKGRCPGGLEPMLKPVAAIAGDAVEQSPDGLVLNGEAFPNTAALAADSLGRPLTSPHATRFAIAANEVFLLSTATVLSFDSRYFGPLPVTAVDGIAIPVWVMAG